MDDGAVATTARKNSFDATIVIRSAGTSHSTFTSSSGSEDGIATFTMPCHNRVEASVTTGASHCRASATGHQKTFMGGKLLVAIAMPNFLALPLKSF